MVATLAEEFGRVYRDGLWARCCLGPIKCGSGPGATEEESRGARAAVNHVIGQYGIRSVLDVPCGDHGWMRLVDLEEMGVERYLGVDIVQEVVEQDRIHFGSDVKRFVQGDARSEQFGDGDGDGGWDLVVCRDMLNHLSPQDGTAALRNLKTQGRWLLATTWTAEVNEPFRGSEVYCKLNLQSPPYGLEEPVAAFHDPGPDPSISKTMALWRGDLWSGDVSDL